MAKKQFKKTTERQQLLLKYSTICMVVVVLLTRFDSGSGGVDALSISLNGNGNRLQQQQQQEDSTQQTQPHQLQHVDTGEAEEAHNYVMQKSTTELAPNINVLSEDDLILNGNGIGTNLATSQLTLGHPFQTLKMIKRAPGGFVGMRGKKGAHGNMNMENDQDFLEDDVYDEGLAFPWQDLANNDDNDDDDEIINWDEYAKPNGRRYKKAPTAFYGVRGKKFTPGNGGNPSGDTYRWNQFLQKLDEDRMRDMIMANVMDTLLENNDGNDDNVEDTQNDIAKRAPTGFTGVRGKRPALSLGGGGGGDSSMDATDKRGLGNAFVGVRGKKDVSHQPFKRSPLGGSESSAMGGPGGKRQRFTDFGNKFVAVRGKKSPYNEEQILANDWAEFNNNMRRSQAESTLSSLLAAAAAGGQGGVRASTRAGAGAGTSMHLLYANSGKRAPSGFLGMRGKRPVTSDDLLTIN